MCELKRGGGYNASNGSTHLVSLPPPDWLVHVLLAAHAEVLDGFGHALQRAVDVLRVHVLRVVLEHAAHRAMSTHEQLTRDIF